MIGKSKKRSQEEGVRMSREENGRVKTVYEKEKATHGSKI